MASDNIFMFLLLFCVLQCAYIIFPILSNQDWAGLSVAHPERKGFHQLLQDSHATVGVAHLGPDR